MAVTHLAHTDKLCAMSVLRKKDQRTTLTFTFNDQKALSFSFLMDSATLFAQILNGAVSNIRFNDLIRLLEELGFREVGGQGSHRIFAHSGIIELINLQVEQGRQKSIRCDNGPYSFRDTI